MNREPAVKVILKLTGMILETHRCTVSRAGQQWLLRHGGCTSSYPDQMSAVLAGCERVIGSGAAPREAPDD